MCSLGAETPSFFVDTRVPKIRLLEDDLMARPTYTGCVCIYI